MVRVLNDKGKKRRKFVCYVYYFDILIAFPLTQWRDWKLSLVFIYPPALKPTNNVLYDINKTHSSYHSPKIHLMHPTISSTFFLH